MFFKNPHDVLTNNILFQKCTQDEPRTKGMPLSSFLLKPMQRITRYPLMIEKVRSEFDLRSKSVLIDT